jgi:hypothetical protein
MCLIQRPNIPILEFLFFRKREDNLRRVTVDNATSDMTNTHCFSFDFLVAPEGVYADAIDVG